MKYFAYGSNMSLRRLRERVPAVSMLGSCALSGHQLRFHKSGQDGSAKCDAFYTGQQEQLLHGALYEIDQGGKSALDRVEGLGMGYQEKLVEVVTAAGVCVEAVTYYATHIDENLLPFCWYRQHVLVGAQELGLPQPHVELIENTEAIRDPDGERHEQQLALYAAGSSPLDQ
ncbi:MAG: gamma-glutamylcyclotransferase [Halieaceae bacterium]